MSDAKALLKSTVKQLQLGDIGLVGGVTGALTTEQVRAVEELAIKVAVAQALIDNIASTPQGIAVRDILPDQDMRDGRAGGDAAITRRDWVQPFSGGGVHVWLAADINTDTTVYKTSRNSNNDRKTYVFYGVKASNIGPADQTTTIGVASITFLRSNTKTVDIWQIEELDSSPLRAVYARTPIVFKKLDDGRINFFAAPKGSGASENLILLGKVAEAINQTVTG